MSTKQTEIMIIVLQRGWVVVGPYWSDGINCGISHGAVIRNWGTERGLGQLYGGPTNKTVLDPVPAEFWHIMTEVKRMSVNQAAWAEPMAKCHADIETMRLKWSS